MGYVATTAGISADDVQDLMVARVEHRFGQVNRLPRPIEWLTNNRSCFAAHETRRSARDMGLIPRTTPIKSPQSNGMAAAFVCTLKRDYVRVSAKPDARSGLDQLPGWIAHYTTSTRTAPWATAPRASTSPVQSRRLRQAFRGQQQRSRPLRA